MSIKNWIFLDIDGTITTKGRPVPARVIDFLKDLYHKGWNIVFLTGRTFSFAMLSLHDIDFPYLLGVQNGADLLRMPEKEVFGRYYLSKNILPEMEGICRNLHEDFLIYGGFDHGDFCYYRKEHFSKKLLEYIEILKTLSAESWKPIDSFEEVGLNEFPLIKCFGTKDQMQTLERSFCDKPHIHTTMIRDPMVEGLFLQMVTSSEATKGKALQHFVCSQRGFVIAAGDDANDIEMLKNADVKIVMNTAPENMHHLADILAEPAEEYGIIAALEEAIKRCKDGR